MWCREKKMDCVYLFQDTCLLQRVATGKPLQVKPLPEKKTFRAFSTLFTLHPECLSISLVTNPIIHFDLSYGFTQDYVSKYDYPPLQL